MKHCRGSFGAAGGLTAEERCEKAWLSGISWSEFLHGTVWAVPPLPLLTSRARVYAVVRLGARIVWWSWSFAEARQFLLEHLIAHNDPVHLLQFSSKAEAECFAQGTSYITELLGLPCRRLDEAK